LASLKTDIIGLDTGNEAYNEASELLEEIKLQIKYGNRRFREKSLVGESLQLINILKYANINKA